MCFAQVFDFVTFKLSRSIWTSRKSDDVMKNNFFITHIFYFSDITVISVTVRRYVLLQELVKESTQPLFKPHWLPACFEILMFAFTILPRLTFITFFLPLHPVRSPSQLLLQVPRSGRKLRGDMAFSTVTP